VDNEADLIASFDYGGQVTAMVGTDHVFGCQFHPEKSGDVGLKMLKNFCRL
jgi:glutamine amidotransferase